MDKPDKVVITITPEGDNITVFSGTKELSNRSSVMISAGESQQKEKGDIYDDIDEDFADLSGAIDGIQLSVFGIAGALYLINGMD
jgi:hypothetical protein